MASHTQSLMQAVVRSTISDVTKAMASTAATAAGVFALRALELRDNNKGCQQRVDGDVAPAAGTHAPGAMELQENGRTHQGEAEVLKDGMLALRTGTSTEALIEMKNVEDIFELATGTQQSQDGTRALPHASGSQLESRGDSAPDAALKGAYEGRNDDEICELRVASEGDVIKKVGSVL